MLKAKIKIKNPRIRAGIGPKPTNSSGKWQSGPSPGPPGGGGAKNKIKNHFKHFQEVVCTSHKGSGTSERHDFDQKATVTLECGVSYVQTHSTPDAEKGCPVGVYML